MVLITVASCGSHVMGKGTGELDSGRHQNPQVWSWPATRQGLKAAASMDDLGAKKEAEAFPRDCELPGTQLSWP